MCECGSVVAEMGVKEMGQSSWTSGHLWVLPLSPSTLAGASQVELWSQLPDKQEVRGRMALSVWCLPLWVSRNAAHTGSVQGCSAQRYKPPAQWQRCLSAIRLGLWHQLLCFDSCTVQ